MSRHSKRNTASSFFTAFERRLLNKDYGTLKARLGSSSFRTFDACKLCLARARQPVTCPSNGDLFCRECIMENLLSQRQEIKRFEKELERKRQDEEEAEILEDEAVQERAVREFELVQMGLSVAKPGSVANIVGRENGKVVVVEKKGEKRKFELDEEELIEIARADREKAKRALTEEKVRTYDLMGDADCSWLLRRKGDRISGFRP
jgi:nitric oxide synthase-interacting protein